RPGDPGPMGDVLELTSALVPIEPAGRIRLAGGRDDRAAVAEVDIEEPVTVGVEDRDPAAHHFGEVMLASRAGLEPERDPGRGGPVCGGGWLEWETGGLRGQGGPPGSSGAGVSRARPPVGKPPSRRTSIRRFAVCISKSAS